MTSTNVAAEIREHVRGSRECFWHPGDFPGSRGAVDQALSRLAQDGELRPVRRGLYWRGKRTPLGMAPPPEDRLIREIAGSRGVGPAGLSAANALGLTTQVPRRSTIAVISPPPRDLPALHFVGRASARRRTTLKPAEIALLEVLRDWEDVVEVKPEEAIGRIADLMASGSLRADKLASAAKTEPASVRAGLCGLLNKIGKPETASAIPLALNGRHVLAA